MDPKTILSNSLKKKFNLPHEKLPTEAVEALCANGIPGREAIHTMKSELEPFGRKLSGHVTTRCYRAPEVVLLEKHYHMGVDLWAVGVIMFELFKYNATDNGKRSDRLQAFDPKRCFPVSPQGTIFESDGLPNTNGDLLNEIFDLIGTPSESDLDFICDEEAKFYIRKFP